jgi:membrane protein DedA with SNARE-associated domain
VAENTPVTVHRNERVLTFIIASCIGLSVIAFAIVFIGRAAGANMDTQIWLTLLVLPEIGFPLGILCIIILLVVSAIRRAREARDA